MSIYFLESIPEKFGYSLGGYSHRERCRAPDRKKLTKGRREVKDDDKEQVDGSRFRYNWLHFIGNKLRLYCQQNEHRLLPSGVIHES
jgi:hypothetical protein